MEVINIKNKIKLKVRIVIIVIIFSLVAFGYQFNKNIMSTIIIASDAEMRGRATEIINKIVLDEYSKQFNYNNIINIEKDRDGNIVMLQADTLKLNKIACDVSIKTQNQLRNMGDTGIKIPLGYIFKNSILAYIGPKIMVKMQPIGSIETKYISQFQSSGINQTRHKIFVKLNTTIRVIIPLMSNDIKIENEIPISEIIIVGKVPETSVQLDLTEAGFKLNNLK